FPDSQEAEVLIGALADLDGALATEPRPIGGLIAGGATVKSSTAQSMAASSWIATWGDQSTEDPSQSGDPRRKRDLESTFLSFTIDTADGRFHDQAVREQFQLALLWAGQAWDQDQAGVQGHRRHSRQEKFRQQLARLLEGDAYMWVD